MILRRLLPSSFGSYCHDRSEATATIFRRLGQAFIYVFKRMIYRVGHCNRLGKKKLFAVAVAMPALVDQKIPGLVDQKFLPGKVM